MGKKGNFHSSHTESFRAEMWVTAIRSYNKAICISIDWFRHGACACGSRLPSAHSTKLHDKSFERKKKKIATCRCKCAHDSYSAIIECVQFERIYNCQLQTITLSLSPAHKTHTHIHTHTHTCTVYTHCCCNHSGRCFCSTFIWILRLAASSSSPYITDLIINSCAHNHSVCHKRQHIQHSPVGHSSSKTMRHHTSACILIENLICSKNSFVFLLGLVMTTAGDAIRRCSCWWYCCRNAPKRDNTHSHIQSARPFESSLFQILMRTRMA